MSRPFAVGDLLILADTTQCELISFSIQKHTVSKEFKAGDTTLSIKIRSGNECGMYFENANNVKTIRTLRKGGKEARDIVAMLAKFANKDSNIYIEQLKKTLRAYIHDYENYDDFDDIEEEKDSLPFLIERQKGYIGRAYKNKKTAPNFRMYRKAKQMLGDNNA